MAPPGNATSTAAATAGAAPPGNATSAATASATDEDAAIRRDPSDVCVAAATAVVDDDVDDDVDDTLYGAVAAQIRKFSAESAIGVEMSLPCFLAVRIPILYL